MHELPEVWISQQISPHSVNKVKKTCERLFCRWKVMNFFVQSRTKILDDMYPQLTVTLPTGQRADQSLSCSFAHHRQQIWRLSGKTHASTFTLVSWQPNDILCVLWHFKCLLFVWHKSLLGREVVKRFAVSQSQLHWCNQEFSSVFVAGIWLWQKESGQ